MRRRRRPREARSPAERPVAARAVVRRIETTSDLGRREAEALRVEIWGLARRYGIQLKTLRVESIEPEDPDPGSHSTR